MIVEEGIVATSPHFLCPPWSGRYGVEVYSTTRVGGFSNKPYDSLNLGLHVNDDAEQVARNRRCIEHLTLFIVETQRAGFKQRYKPGAGQFGVSRRQHLVQALSKTVLGKYDDIGLHRIFRHSAKN